jgi:hypothetical protein
MAETKRISSAPTHSRRASRPRLPHPPRVVPPPRRTLDETQNLRPPEPAEAIETPRPEPVDALPSGPADVAPPRRTSADGGVLAVLVLGLALNALVLLRYAALTRADILLGTTVLLAGLALLVLMEVYRRTER